jgi:DNA-directed RNA polymerase specialized sigma24 family protein
LDDLIRAWMTARDADEASKLLEEILLRHVTPVCRSVTRRRRYSAQEAADIESEVALRMVGRLRAVKTGVEQPLEDARKYVLTVAFSACHALVRKRHPERARLKNRIRYVASHDPRLAIWERQDRDWVVGLRAHEGQTPGPEGPRAVPGRGELDQVLLAVCKSGPIGLDDAVTLAAEALGIHDGAAVAEQDVADRGAAVDLQLSQRSELEWLWREMQELPERQRAALLLNLRDDGGHGVIELLPATGVATIRQIAAAVGMAIEVFAALWRELPVEDARIAELLGVSRQQVINLRKAGRFRLLRKRQRNTGPVSVSYTSGEERP